MQKRECWRHEENGRVRKESEERVRKRKLNDNSKACPRRVSSDLRHDNQWQNGGAEGWWEEWKGGRGDIGGGIKTKQNKTKNILIYIYYVRGKYEPLKNEFWPP